MSLLENPTSLRPLAPEFYERVWGSRQLEPWFPNPAEKIGEVWFQETDSPVLVKFLFAAQNLSVQVHPGDSLARELGHQRGKTEMWHILRAEPSAKIALGFREPVAADQVRLAAADGSIMEMLRWIPVSAGDTWFIPAGAVHAIGAGIALCEVQQNSDVTYRLFDYGRGRALHIEESLRALDLHFQPQPIPRANRVLVNCPFFRVDQLAISGASEASKLDLLIGLEGSGMFNGKTFVQGTVWGAGPDQPIHIEGHAKLLTVATKT